MSLRPRPSQPCWTLSPPPVCGKYGLQPRGSGGVDSGFDGTFDISNKDRLGKSEVDLVNCMIRGVKMLLQMENRLEAGESIDDLIAASGGGGASV